MGRKDGQKDLCQRGTTQKVEYSSIFTVNVVLICWIIHGHFREILLI